MAVRSSSQTSPPGRVKRPRDSTSRSVSRDPDHRPSKRLSTPLRNRKRPTPEQRFSSDDDASDTDTSFELRKRARTEDSAEPDLARRIRSLKAFSEENVKPLPLVHAADITSKQKAGNFRRAFGGADRPTEILLQYPSASLKERFALQV